MSSLLVMCVDPPIPSNGGYVSNGSVLTYMCQEGFVLIGNRVRYCNLTTWMFNGSDPTCEGILLLIVAIGISNTLYNTIYINDQHCNSYPCLRIKIPAFFVAISHIQHC